MGVIVVAVYSGAMTYFILKVFFFFKRICGVLRRSHVCQLEGVPFLGGVQGLGLRA
jgi:hypothetical protein